MDLDEGLGRVGRREMYGLLILCFGVLDLVLG